MQATVDVRLTPRGPWRPAVLTTDRAGSSHGLPVVVVAGEDFARGSGEVETIRVMHDCPVALADAAVEAGFHVLGQPRGGQESRV